MTLKFLLIREPISKSISLIKVRFFHYRLEGRYQVSNKSSLRLVYAPFTVKVTGRADKDVVFNGETFSKDQDLTVSYKF